MSKKYQIFISYRYEGLDAFIAEEIHKELDSYKLPRSLRKGKKKEEYTIGDIFQDKLKLSVSSDLWQSIEVALLDSEYLIVICSPRISESSWCHREIETYVNKYGRDHVITVLAEGEPDDSIPDLLKINGRIPFAADVRGKTKREIKKKIKEVLPRIVAPIFGYEYEQLRSKTIEAAWKKRIAIMTLISVFLFITGNFTFAQLVETKRQMRLNMMKKEEIATYLAEKNMKEWDYNNAAKNLLDVLPKDLDDPEYPVLTKTEYALSNLLGVYDISKKYDINKYLFEDDNGNTIYPLSMKQVSDDIIVMSSIDGNQFYFYDLEKHKVIYKYENNQEFDYNENYVSFYNGELFYKCVTSDEKAVYFSIGNDLYAVSLSDGKEIWSTKLDCNMAVVENQEYLYAYNYNIISKIDKHTGKVIKEQKSFDGISAFENLECSEDGKYLYGYTSDQFISEDLETGKVQTYNTICKINTNSLNLEKEAKIEENMIDQIVIDDKAKQLYINYTSIEQKNDNVEYTNEAIGYVECYSLEDLSLSWSYQTNKCITNLYVSKIASLENELIVAGINIIMTIDKSTGKEVKECIIPNSEKIKSIIEYPNDDPEKQDEYKIIMASGDGKLINKVDGEFQFLIDEFSNIQFDNLHSILKTSTGFVGYCPDDSCYLQIKNVDLSNLEITTDVESIYEKDSGNTHRLSIDETEEINSKHYKIIADSEKEKIHIYKNEKEIYSFTYDAYNFDGMVLSEHEDLLFLNFRNRKAMAIHMGNTILEEDIFKFDNTNIFFIEDINRKDMIEISTDNGDNIYKYDEKLHTFEPYANVAGYIYYDRDKDKICMYSSEGFYMYQNVYTTKELVDMTKEKLSQ